ncbi:MAG: DNA mismatch repair endonuclease MutL [Crocinitomicaceae bacterium]|nr:DNA mismatch repair endonuclease MutL [Crocinitomicaceae bacterium]
MSDLIQLLPDHIANQIAAGEVIQRPASVIKELMENAIDADATKVDVNIKEAGKSLIQVVDNGKGMSPSDSVFCFERHATSKVTKVDDLFSLSTKGFRGEALASIAAIAHVELKTKTKEQGVGFHVCIEGSEIKTQEEVVTPDGTSFEIKNLFFNVPARRNFLKSNQVEFRHIQDEFERVALAHPDVHFTLTHNGNEIHNTSPGVLRKRIADILGKKSNDRLVPIEESTEIVSVKGFVLKPEFAKKTRGEQYLFVNDRFFKNPYFNHALTKAFTGLIKERTFPGFFLYLTVDPKKIDVNVHPTKTEIKFEEEKFIYSILLSSVKLALGKYNIAPTLDFEQETSFEIPHAMRSQPTVEPSIKVDTTYNPFKTTSASSSGSSGGIGKAKDNNSKAISKYGFGNERADSKDWENFYSIEEDGSDKEEIIPIINEESEVPQTKNYLIKGSFILSPSKSGFMVVHARRAIEQIVYSEMIKSFISNPISSQKLLFPIEKELANKELIAWQENASILKQLGMSGEIKEDVLELTAVPSVLQEETIQNALDRIIETISHRTIEKGEIAHELVHSLAKSSARKKLNLSTPELIEHLIEQLFQCENHMYTPGNKKIVDTLELTVLEDKFN